MDGADALRVPDSPRPGDEVGVFRLLEELGAGGMGRVFLAEHQKLGRRVALKILQPELWHNRRSVQRFFQEARLVNRIDHENIVQIHDYIQEADGLSYLIMELLVGRDLTQSREQGGLFSVARTLPILRQVAAALAAAHAQGVVHRDLKPGNIFLVQKGSRRDFVKLLDFGIAKLQDDADLNAPQTRTGSIVGTPLYMSPEQASGEKVDARSDLYSLGVVAYWMLADSFPFKAKSFAELLVKQQSQRPSELPERSASGEPIPHQLAEVVARCLERDREIRFQTAEALEAALAEVAGEVPAPIFSPLLPVARPRTRTPASRALDPHSATVEIAGSRAKKGTRLWPGLLAAGLAAAVVGAGLLLWTSRTGSPFVTAPPKAASPVAANPGALPPKALEAAPTLPGARTEAAPPAPPQLPASEGPTGPAPAARPAAPQAERPLTLQPPARRSTRPRAPGRGTAPAKPMGVAKGITKPAAARPRPTSPTAGDDDVLDPFGK